MSDCRRRAAKQSERRTNQLSHTQGGGEWWEVTDNLRNWFWTEYAIKPLDSPFWDRSLGQCSNHHVRDFNNRVDY